MKSRFSIREKLLIFSSIVLVTILRDPARIQIIISLLETCWKANPDLRLFQIISNISRNTNFSVDQFYMEDDLLKTLLEEEISKLRNLNSSDS